MLDLGLPGIDGLEVIRRAARLDATCRSSCSPSASARADKVAALDAGADDYVTKPFGMDELLARATGGAPPRDPGEEEAVVETPRTSASTSPRSGSPTRPATTCGSPRPSGRSSRSSPATPASSSRSGSCSSEVWGPQYATETNYLRVYLAQIRRKLEPDPARPRYFITEPRMGYRFRIGD